MQSRVAASRRGPLWHERRGAREEQTSGARTHVTTLLIGSRSKALDVLTADVCLQGWCIVGMGRGQQGSCYVFRLIKSVC